MFPESRTAPAAVAFRFTSAFLCCAVILTAFAPLACTSAIAAEIVTLEPTQDNSMYEEDGNLSNGAGIYLFFGLTDDTWARRSLLLFDVAGNIPAGSTITEAGLSINVNREPAGAPDGMILLHRSEAPWGEEASDASGQEGTGAQAEPGDATWTFRSYSTVRWVDEGGELIQPVSATVLISGLGIFEFTGSGLVFDVQDMLDVPATNFGWIVVGDEIPNSRTARRIASRENNDARARPQLTITYDPPVPTEETSVGEFKSGYVD